MKAASDDAKPNGARQAETEAPAAGARGSRDDALTDLRLARATALVERQREMMGRAQAQGGRTDPARSLLRTMESVLEAMRRDRRLAARTAFRPFTRNRLLRALPPGDFARLAASLTPVRLDQDQILAGAHEPMDAITFVESGVVSAVVVARDGKTLEVGTIGFEGMVGLEIALGSSRSPLRYAVRFAGDGLRIDAGAFLALLDLSPELSGLMHRYAYLAHVQIALTAAAIGFASVEERVARWLLMYHDRLESPELPVTHDVLAAMVGVRRASVTEALHKLEGMRAIRSNRALIRVRNPCLLKEIARSTYGVGEAEYERLVPQPPSLVP